MRKALPPAALSWIAWLPVAGVAAFIVLYFCAASMYPGGTRFDSTTRGYNHLSNYWCDLLGRASYDGNVNPGRPFAILATILLPLSLIPLWLQVPVLFRDASASKWFVRLAGPSSMILATLIFTRMHDLVINSASLFGIAAFAVTALSLARSRHTVLAGAAVVALGLATTTWCMWQARAFLPAMPVVQKMAYASFFLWIVGTSHAIRCSLATRAAAATLSDPPSGPLAPVRRGEG